MDDYGSQSVQLHIYDMTQGMAAVMSPILLGKNLKILKFVYNFSLIQNVFHVRSENRRCLAYRSGGVRS